MDNSGLENQNSMDKLESDKNSSDRKLKDLNALH